MNPEIQDCVFCKIVRGELSSCKIYEDGEIIAFMDIGPIIKGHALVIPRRHYPTLFDTPPDVLEKLILAAQKIAIAQKHALCSDGINVMQSNGRSAGQVVDHIHFHVIPRFNADGHHWNWKAQKYADGSEMQALADKIKNALISHKEE